MDPHEIPEAAKQTLTRKVGPLPVWVWGGIGIGAVVLLRMHKGGGSSTSGLTPYAFIPSGSDGGGGGGGGGGGDTPTPTPNPSPTPSPTPSPAPSPAPAPAPSPAPAPAPGPSAAGTDYAANDAAVWSAAQPIIDRVWGGHSGTGQNVEDVLAATTPAEQQTLAAAGVFGDPAHPPLGRNSVPGAAPLPVDWSGYNHITSGYGVNPATGISVPVVRVFQNGVMVSERFFSPGTVDSQVNQYVSASRQQWGVM